MAKEKIKRVLALLLVIFILAVFILTVYFGITGRSEIALSLLAFNGFFTIIVYFLMRLQSSINSSIDDMHSDEDYDDHSKLDVQQKYSRNPDDKENK